MSKIQVTVDEQTAATMHALVVQMRAMPVTQDTDGLDDHLRDVELALAGALRSVGWEPNPNGSGWYMRGAGRRRRR